MTPAHQPPTPHLDMLIEARLEGGVLLRGGDTPSMLGQGMNNSYLLVVPQDQYAPGDDVTFKVAGGKLVTHRVEHIKDGYVYTKGTFNRNGDGWIPLADVVGRVKKVYRPK